MNIGRPSFLTDRSNRVLLSVPFQSQITIQVLPSSPHQLFLQWCQESARVQVDFRKSNRLCALST